MQAACSNVHHRLSNMFWLRSVNIYTLKAYNCKFTIERNVKQFTFRRYLSLRKLPVHCVLSTAVSFSIYQTWNERHEGRFVQQEKIFILFQSSEKSTDQDPFGHQVQIVQHISLLRILVWHIRFTKWVSNVLIGSKLSTRVWFQKGTQWW